MFRIIKLWPLDIQAMDSVVYKKNDKAVVTLPFIILFIQDCNPSTPQVVATKNCLSIYSLQTCSWNFYYLHTPVLWLSKWHSAVHHSLLCCIRSISDSEVPRLLNICLCLKTWVECIFSIISMKFCSRLKSSY